MGKYEKICAGSLLAFKSVLPESANIDAQQSCCNCTSLCERDFILRPNKSVYVQNIPHKVCRTSGCYYARHLNTKCYQHIFQMINRYVAAIISVL